MKCQKYPCQKLAVMRLQGKRYCAKHAQKDIERFGLFGQVFLMSRNARIRRGLR